MKRMPLPAALDVLHDLRREQIVVTTMSTAREWPKRSQSPLDFHFLPSAMGHAPVLALGLALAQPEREVIGFNGDGGMIMNLGALVTVAAAGATNLTIIVIDNGIYEVTGGQPTAAALCGVDFAGLGRAAGLSNVAQFDDLESWRRSAAEIFSRPGPRLIALRVDPVGPDFQLPTPEPVATRLARFQHALGLAGTTAAS